MSEHETLGWRQVLGTVNLRDFAGMVRGELIIIGTSVQRAVAALRRLPFGPLFFFAYLMLALLRSILLAVIVVTFGTGILLLSAVRGVMRVMRGAPEGPER